MATTQIPLPLEPFTDAPLFHLGTLPISQSGLIYASIIFIITVILITSGVTAIWVLATTDSFKQVISYYLISLSVSDVLCGILVTPLSVYSALDDQWEYGEVLCKLESYVELLLWSSQAYMFIWLSVDRYAALHKPARYEVEQTLTKCRCWIVLSWTTSILLCCPTLFTEMKTQFYSAGKLCLLDWGVMRAYSVTLGVLVIVPSLVWVGITQCYICNKFRHYSTEEHEIQTLLDVDTSYLMTFFILLVFVLSWLPWFLLRAYEAVTETEVPSDLLHFCFVWLAISGGSWKLVIYSAMNPQFRRGVQSLYKTICCCFCVCVSGNRRKKYVAV